MKRLLAVLLVSMLLFTACQGEKQMKLEDVFRLAEMGETLALDDLKGYRCTEVADARIFTRTYTLEDNSDYTLHVNGSSDGVLSEVKLVHPKSGHTIDIRHDDILPFLDDPGYYFVPDVPDTPDMPAEPEGLAETEHPVT